MISCLLPSATKHTLTINVTSPLPNMQICRGWPSKRYYGICMPKEEDKGTTTACPFWILLYPYFSHWGNFHTNVPCLCLKQLPPIQSQLLLWVAADCPMDLHFPALKNSHLHYIKVQLSSFLSTKNFLCSSIIGSVFYFLKLQCIGIAKKSPA